MTLVFHHHHHTLTLSSYSNLTYFSSTDVICYIVDKLIGFGVGAK